MHRLNENLVSHHHQVTKEEYVQHGSVALGMRLVAKLREEGRRPAFVPVGGSNALGTWGYLEFVQELAEQAGQDKFTDIVMVGV